MRLASMDAVSDAITDLHNKLQSDIENDINNLDKDLTNNINNVQSGLTNDINNVQSGLTSDINNLEKELRDYIDEISSANNQNTSTGLSSLESRINSELAKKVNKSGDTITGNLTVNSGKIIGTLQGNSDTATKLAAQRTINGTAFDGTVNITTANWGTSRNFVITDGTNTSTAVSVNGSNAVSLKLPTTINATLSGNASSATKLATKRTINGTEFDGTANITTANWGTGRAFTVSDGTNVGTSVTVNGGNNVTLRLPTTINATLSGNASSATKLNTARTITIGEKSNTFDGTKNITFSISDMGVAPASHGTHVTYGGNGSATTVSRSDHTHNYLPLSGGTMTGAITRNNSASSWVAAANGNSILYSSKDPGAFHPIASAQTTTGRMVLAYYSGELDVSYLTKENCDANKNTVSKMAVLMNEAGGASWPGTVEAGALLSSSLNGIDGGIHFKAHADDSAHIKTNIDGSTTYLDFHISDDAGSDAFRWTAGLWDSNSNSQVRRNAMILHPGIYDSQLYVHDGLVLTSRNYQSDTFRPVSGNWFKGIVTVNGDGVMEAGKYLDLHNTNNTNKDYSTRIQCMGDTGNSIYLPTTSGTVSLDGHTHDDRYYTEGEVNNLVNGRVDWNSYNGFVGKFYMQDGRMLYMCSWDPGAIGAGNVWIQCG
jgi:hypothetical protein